MDVRTDTKSYQPDWRHTEGNNSMQRELHRQDHPTDTCPKVHVAIGPISIRINNDCYDSDMGLQMVGVVCNDCIISIHCHATTYAQTQLAGTNSVYPTANMENAVKYQTYRP